jgi:hypothetical protein
MAWALAWFKKEVLKQVKINNLGEDQQSDEAKVWGDFFRSSTQINLGLQTIKCTRGGS